MTDLTDKWKKGELPEGVYYVLYYKNDTAEVDIYRRVYSLYNESEVRFTIPQVTKILAEVPTFDEWKASEKYNKHLEEVIKIYERKDKQATETSIAYNKLAEENDKLKELLKECREFFYENLIDSEFHFSYGLGSNIKKQSCIRSLSNLKTKINQALGEDK